MVKEKIGVLTCNLYSLISASSEATSLLMMRFGQDLCKLRRQVSRRPLGVSDDDKATECLCSASRAMSEYEW